MLTTGAIARKLELQIAERIKVIKAIKCSEEYIQFSNMDENDMDEQTKQWVADKNKKILTYKECVYSDEKLLEAIEQSVLKDEEGLFKSQKDEYNVRHNIKTISL